MRRHLKPEISDVQLQDYDYHPGCMWGILHVLDYHHWHHSKKMLPHKKHSRRRHARCFGIPKTISMKHDTGEEQLSLNAKADNLLVQQHARRTRICSANLSLLTTREKCKGDYKHWNAGFSAHPELKPTDLIRECSDYPSGEVSSGWINPIILIHNRTSTAGGQVASYQKHDLCDTMNAEDYLEHNQILNHGVFLENVGQASNSQKQMDKKFNRGFSLDQVKEYSDLLEMLKVNKEVFLKILQDPDIGITKHFPGKQTIDAKGKLTKSGSFPVAASSHVRFLRPTTLEHKQNESWSFPRRQYLLAAARVPKSDASESQKDHYVTSVSHLANSNIGSGVKQKTSSSSHGPLWTFDNQRWNQMVMNRFKEIKQRIKHALKEQRRKNKHTSSAVVLSRVPPGCDLSTDGKETMDESKSIMGQDGVKAPRRHEIDVSDCDQSKNTHQQMRRTTSLNESLDRYAQLLEHGPRREAKLHQSKSLRLANEDKNASKERAPKFFRRISSLSDLESFCSFLNEVSNSALSSDMPIRNSLDWSTKTESDVRWEVKSHRTSVDTDKVEHLDAIMETEFKKNMVGESEHRLNIDSSDGLMVHRIDEDIVMTCGLTENIFTTITEERSNLQYHDSTPKISPRGDLAQPSSVSVLESCSSDSLPKPAEFPLSEGSDLHTGCICLDGADFSLKLQSTESSQGFYSKAKHKNAEYTKKEVSKENENAEYTKKEVGKENDPFFSYVRDVLEQSGFLGNNFLGKWNSLDQPLDPSLFKNFEASSYHELESSPEELQDSYDQQLLFDLINEALRQIKDRSFSYFPNTFSFTCSVLPAPRGHRLLKEVWGRISWHLSSPSEVDQSLDDIMGRDLEKGDGWMNLLPETDYVALDLEDLIFNELLDEVICE